MIFHSRPVHSLMLSSYHFLCLPLHGEEWALPCDITQDTAHEDLAYIIHQNLDFVSNYIWQRYGNSLSMQWATAATLLSLLANITNDWLPQILGHHTQIVRRPVRDKPSAPWTSEEREAFHWCRQTDQWLWKSSLAVQRGISAKVRGGGKVPL